MSSNYRNYGEVAEAVKHLIPLSNYDDGSLAPLILRLAWHACATYDKRTGTGGSNGATMRYHLEATDEGNSGLEVARHALEPIKLRFDWISYADLWTLSGVVALQCMNGPSVTWIPGRVDYEDDSKVPPNGRLPLGVLGADHVRETFDRMGFNDQETVALIGAHNVGRTHASRSGFEGAWVDTPLIFSNKFFQQLLEADKWYSSVSPVGRPQFYTRDKSLMLLPTDMSLIEDVSFRHWATAYAQDEDLFREHFALAFAKLLELGVPR